MVDKYENGMTIFYEGGQIFLIGRKNYDKGR